MSLLQIAALQAERVQVVLALFLSDQAVEEEAWAAAEELAIHSLEKEEGVEAVLAEMEETQAAVQEMEALEAAVEEQVRTPLAAQVSGAAAAAAEPLVPGAMEENQLQEGPELELQESLELERLMGEAAVEAAVRILLRVM